MPANDVTKIIKASNIENIVPESVFAYVIPGRTQDKPPGNLVVYCTEPSKSSGDFGSDDMLNYDSYVQVQFFYPLSADYDLSNVEEPVRKLLLQNGWRYTTGGETNRDPKTGQLYSTYHFHKKIQI